VAERFEREQASLGVHDATPARGDQAAQATATARKLVLSGRGDPAQVAAGMRANPALQAEMVAYMQTAFGNAFVQAVVTALRTQDSGAAAAATETAAPTPPPAPTRRKPGGPISEEEIYADRHAYSENKWKNDPMLARAMARQRGEAVEELPINPELGAPSASAAPASAAPATATATTATSAPAASVSAAAPTSSAAPPSRGMPDERNVYEANRAAYDERWKTDPMYERAMARIRARKAGGGESAAPAAEAAAPAAAPAAEVAAPAAAAEVAAPAAAAEAAAPMSTTKEGLESLNSEGAFDYRLQRVERLRQDVLTGSETEISPDVSPEMVALMRDNIGKLTNEQLAAIQGYTSQDYKSINAVMRNPNADPAKTARLAGYISAISSGLAALPSYEGEVYRGTAMSQRVWSDWERAYAAGTPVSDAAFSSSSKSEAVAEDFLDQTRADGKVSVFCKIQSRSGKQVEFLSKTANEVEVLFRGGAKFKIVYITDSTGPDGKPRKEVMLREVADDEAAGGGRGGQAGGGSRSAGR
jgi:hypothetical protein